MKRVTYVFYIFCLIFDIAVTFFYGNPKGEINSVIKWLLNYFGFRSAVVIYGMLEFIAVSVVFSLMVIGGLYFAPIIFLAVLGAFHIHGGLTWLTHDVALLYRLPVIVVLLYFIIVEALFEFWLYD